jgi:hypothetical protein
MYEQPQHDDPVAREKLLRARGEIAEIIKRYDIAAFVVMHAAPHASEVMIELSPSYSVVTLKEGVARIISKLADYNGDKDAQRYDMAASANMASSMFELMAHTTMLLGDLAQRLDEITGSTHTEMTHIKPN